MSCAHEMLSGENEIGNLFPHVPSRASFSCSLHGESKKKQDTKLLPITSPNMNRCSNFFYTERLGSKFATNVL